MVEPSHFEWLSHFDFESITNENLSLHSLCFLLCFTDPAGSLLNSKSQIKSKSRDHCHVMPI